MTWQDLSNPGCGPTIVEGDTSHQINEAHCQWEDDYNTFKTFYNTGQVLNKQIITVFEPMYLDILNDDIVGFSNTSVRDMSAYLLTTYGSITRWIWNIMLAPCAMRGIHCSQLKL
jgi:hypothetical protein